MLPTPGSSVRRTVPRVFAGPGLAGALFLAGCASPGPPRPPSLNLPRVVTDLTAERIGDQVFLHWTTPAKTTDGLAVSAVLTARVCRTGTLTAGTLTGAVASRSPTASGSNAPCVPVVQVATQPGASSATETLPAALTAEPTELMTYRVEIANSMGHAAGPSNPAFVASGAVPTPIQNLRAVAVPEGAMLEWDKAVQPVPPGLPIDIRFIELQRINPALAAAHQSTAKSKSSHPLQLAGVESPEIHLRAKASGPREPEPSGTVDRTAHFGETYRYVAQRVRLVQLGVYALEVRSVPSAPVTLTLRDTFPPAVPTGLAGIPGLAGASTGAASMDLSWEPNSEPDLAGYMVYRAAGDTAASRLTPTPLPGPAFRDATAVPGVRYSYTVTAVDNSGNESAPSAPIDETLPKP